MINLFELIDEFLDELESRLQLSPEFIKEMEAGDYSDFVEINPKEFEVSFWDRVDDFARATKIREYVDATNSILLYAKKSGKITKLFQNEAVEQKYIDVDFGNHNS